MGGRGGGVAPLCSADVDANVVKWAKLPATEIHSQVALYTMDRVSLMRIRTNTDLKPDKLLLTVAMRYDQ